MMYVSTKSRLGVRIMASQVKPGPYLLLLEILRDSRHAPVLIPDMRAHLSELIWARPVAELELFDSTKLFHLLRDWASEGLVEHTGKGYDVTDLGRRQAKEFCLKYPGTANELRRAALASAD